MAGFVRTRFCAAVIAALFASGPALAAEQVASAAAGPAPSLPPAQDQPCGASCFTPVEAVNLASQVAPKGGLAGRFAIYVKAAGEQGGRFFLNSEEDYRDRNCLTVAMSADMAARVAGSSDLAAVRDRFVGKWLILDGVARRVLIGFTLDGKPTGKYYYQVHVTLSDLRQIRTPGTGKDPSRAF